MTVSIYLDGMSCCETEDFRELTKSMRAALHNPLIARPTMGIYEQITLFGTTLETRYSALATSGEWGGAEKKSSFFHAGKNKNNLPSTSARQQKSAPAPPQSCASGGSDYVSAKERHYINMAGADSFCMDDVAEGDVSESGDGPGDNKNETISAFVAVGLEQLLKE